MSASWCPGWVHVDGHGQCSGREGSAGEVGRERPMDRGIERDRTTKHKQKRQRNTDTNVHHGSDDDDMCNRTRKNAKTQIELEMNRNRNFNQKRGGPKNSTAEAMTPMWRNAGIGGDKMLKTFLIHQQ